MGWFASIGHLLHFEADVREVRAFQVLQLLGPFELLVPDGLLLNLRSFGGSQSLGGGPVL